MWRRQKREGQRGHAIIEVSMMAPWIFFLMIGTLDFGFYAYAAIATENAARVAAAQTSYDASSASSNIVACNYAIGELQSIPNMSGVSTCVTSPSSITATQPVSVVAAQVVGPDGAQASQVTVTYRSMQMIAIPGLLPSQITLTRIAQMRLKNQ